MDELKVFSGNAHTSLATDIAAYLGQPLGKCEVMQFSNENIFVRILENVRERDVFIVQPLSSPVNQNLVELLISSNALKRASAERINRRGALLRLRSHEKKDQPRVPIPARLVAGPPQRGRANRVRR
jgi:ribose-phosphate pyrophosphokinase